MSKQSIREPPRETPVLKRTDVLVVGGGTAGVSAAVAAARAGAEVTLVERYGSLGGLATGGLIALLLTLDDGKGRPVIGGLCQEATERMTAAGGAFHDLTADYLQTYRDKIDAVTPQELQRAAKRYFRPEDIHIVLAGDAKKVYPQVAALAPNVIVRICDVDGSDITETTKPRDNS